MKKVEKSFGSQVYKSLNNLQGVSFLVSEYVAPDFAHEVWSTDTKTSMHCREGKAPRVEKLFQVEYRGVMTITEDWKEKLDAAFAVTG